MQPTTFDTETELSAVNSILASIGQAPITTLNFENPECSFVYQLLQESSVDVQNEGWVYNRELHYPLNPDSDDEVVLPENILRMDISEGQVCRTSDVIQRAGKLYNKMTHSFKFDKPISVDIVWKFPFVELPSVFKRYIISKASTRAAIQMVSNPQLAQLLTQQEAIARAACLEYECNQGDYTMLGTPAGTAYRPYIPFSALDR